MKLRIGHVETPVGEMVYALGDSGVCALGFSDGWDRLERGLRRRFGELELVPDEGSTVAERLRDYLGGDLGALDDLEVDAGGTPFQQQVWQALRGVGPGTTTSYSALAAALGREGSQRAVANANASNPVSVIVPCHRVIGRDGSLTGYGFGLERKRWLLEHEGVTADGGGLEG